MGDVDNFCNLLDDIGGIGHWVVPSKMMKDPDAHLTPIGPFMRKLSLDELPQLWSVLKGDMSFVGPRPGLFNQDDLIALGTEKGVHRLIPGITLDKTCG